MKNRRIMLIHHRLPYPPHSGMDKARFSLIKLLFEHFHITLIVHNTKNLSENNIRAVKDTCDELLIIDEKERNIWDKRFLKKTRTLEFTFKSLLFFKPTFISTSYSTKFNRAIKKLLISNSFQIVQPLSDYTLDYVRACKTDALLFFGPNDDMVGMSESILDVTKGFIERLLLKIEIRARNKWQQKNIRAADKIAYFSQKDINSIVNRNPEFKDKLLWMPGIIEYETSWSRESLYTVENNSLIFTGGLVSGFNKRSLIYFFEEIWPIILEKNPDVKLYIVGQNIGNYFQQKYGFPNVIYTGQVDEMRPWIEKSAVFISPVNCGTGIKTKIIEALRYGKPIVTTTLGVNGLWALNEDSIIVRNKPDDFAQEISLLLSNDNYRITTALKSRELFEQYYAPAKVSPKILDIYQRLLRNG